MVVVETQSVGGYLRQRKPVSGLQNTGQNRRGRMTPRLFEEKTSDNNLRSLRTRERAEDSKATPLITTSLTCVDNVDGGLTGGLGKGAGRWTALAVGRIYLFAGL